MTLKFTFNQDKALAALGFVASIEQGLSPLYVSKVLFFAEKDHINRYGRPILGDTFIAMPRGPVPSTVKNYIDQNWDWVERPERFSDYLSIRRTRGLLTLHPGAEAPNLDLLSETDRDCISRAIEFCRTKNPQQLSDLTHFEAAWLNADANRPMDYEDFVEDENPHRDEILSTLRENAAYGVL